MFTIFFRVVVSNYGTIIVETAKANNLKPYEYLELLLQEISVHLYSGKYDPDDDTYLEDLLPWAEALPKKCRKASS